MSKRKVIKFKLHTEVKLPKKFIDGVPSSGAADECVADLRKAYDIECDEKEAITYLKSMGSWDDTELSDHDANLDRLVWIACLDCQDQKTTYWYMGA